MGEKRIEKLIEYVEAQLMIHTAMKDCTLSTPIKDKYLAKIDVYEEMLGKLYEIKGVN